MMSKEERMRLISILKESLEETPVDGGQFKVLYRAATDVCGDGILSNVRNFNLIMGRRMIAYQMRKEGCSLCAIGKKLGKHHASVLHMIRMMDDAITFQFKEELKYWDKFQEKLKEYEYDKGTAQGA